MSRGIHESNKFFKLSVLVGFPLPPVELTVGGCLALLGESVECLQLGDVALESMERVALVTRSARARKTRRKRIQFAFLGLLLGCELICLLRITLLCDPGCSRTHS